MAGVHWWKGHPRVDDGGRVVVRMDPQPTRYLRFVQIGQAEPGALWGIAELFVYQPRRGALGGARRGRRGRRGATAT